VVRARALKLLARREHSATELAHKLRARDCGPEVVSQVLGELQAEGLQSDARFAELHARQRADKGYGPLRIAQELGQRGVDAELAAELLARFADQWPERLAAVHGRKFGAAVPRDMHERGRRARFLQQRGFSAEQIRALFRRLERGTED
jgi:regulatory protein